MRADRLLSMMILLQNRGRMTAGQLAEELEVSERTIYRDVLALSVSGIPVYCERGPGGGVRLVDNYRTSLTGLNENEARALFMLSIPAPLVELGVGNELKAAMLKLAASLPASKRSEEEYVRQRIHLDSIPWFQSEEPAPHLQIIQQAVWHDQRLQVTYRADFGTQIDSVIDPLGLVAKASVWYLVYAREGHPPKAMRVSQVVKAELMDQTFERPPGFDLVLFWQAWSEMVERNQPFYTVKVRAAPSLVPYLVGNYRDPLRDPRSASEELDLQGRVELNLTFESFASAREHILGFGSAIEVLSPEPLRLSVMDYASQITKLYVSPNP